MGSHRQPGKRRRMSDGTSTGKRTTSSSTELMQQQRSASEPEQRAVSRRTKKERVSIEFDFEKRKKSSEWAVSELSLIEDQICSNDTNDSLHFGWVGWVCWVFKTQKFSRVELCKFRSLKRIDNQIEQTRLLLYRNRCSIEMRLVVSGWAKTCFC